MSRPYDLIVFDWDGTLMDSEAKIVRCIQAAAQDANATVPTSTQARDIIGLGLAEAMRQLFPEEPDDRRRLIVDHYRQHFVENDSTEMPLFPGVVDGLGMLEAQGYRMAVATGKSRRGLERVLDDSALRRYFVASRCADETLSKPHPRMLDELIQSTGVNRNRALMVGDTVYDMQMARNAGVDGLAVSYGVHARESLLESGALDCLDAFPEVCRWLNR